MASPILTPDSVEKFSISQKDFFINRKIIPDSAVSNKYQAPYCGAGDKVKPCAAIGGDGKVRGICIHNTEDITTPDTTNPAEQYTRAMWPNCNMRGVAVHYFVYKDVIWQSLEDTEQGWHAGDGDHRRASHRQGEMINGNIDTVAIEVIGAYPESEDTAAALCAHLLKKHSLSPEADIYTHNFFMPSKYCPLYILPHWDSFAAKIKAAFYGTELPEEKVFSVGDRVYFAGGEHYSSANSAVPAANGLGKGNAVVTYTAPGAKHPYHIVSVSPECGVYGWVDATSVSEMPQDEKKPDIPGKESKPDIPNEENGPAAFVPEITYEETPHGPAESKGSDIADENISFFPRTFYFGFSFSGALLKAGAKNDADYVKEIAAKNGFPDYKATFLQDIVLIIMLFFGILKC